ncbi:MAG: hypothetical protein JSW40_06640 [Candidatus Omnitrophota bacterium]|nr:MAG: hypothetical protein JSW40_06640 [Candidatus Omnitrophota bacterium]
MFSDIIKTLKSVGFTEKEIKVYLACLELGKSSVIQIAQRAQIRRTTAYIVIESLLDKGILSKHEDKKGQKFSAESPEKLLGILQEKQTELLKIIPNLLAITKAESSIKPEVKFYQGKEGLKTVYEDTLLSCEKGDELLGYFSGEDVYNLLPGYTPNYVKRRAVKGIKARGIALDSKITRKHKARDKKELRQSKLVSKEKFPVCIEKNIYKDKVVFMNFRGFPFGVIVKSPQIAKSEKAIFDLLWSKLRD